ncbi:MAG TPA: heavy metal translocating P-type ATPase, partial [Clostridiales bacterium UBA8960]|nr:heavy metal translocating P-type ATPase [Clostridiales bacterium UBA8960]
MKTEIYKIDGMTCASCSSAVERATRKLVGVESSDVNLSTEKLTITYNETALEKESIVETVKKAGYSATIEVPDKTITMPIEGMTCASCSQSIERKLSKNEGVTSITVNLATETAQIIYNPDKVRLSELKQQITKLGYTPKEIVVKRNVDEDKLRKEKEIKIMKFKLVVAAIFTIPLVYIAMVPMIKFIDLPYPEILSMMMNPLNNALTQIALVL